MNSSEVQQLTSTVFFPLRVSPESCVAHIGQREREAGKKQNLTFQDEEMMHLQVSVHISPALPVPVTHKITSLYQ